MVRLNVTETLTALIEASDTAPTSIAPVAVTVLASTFARTACPFVVAVPISFFA